MSSGVPLSPADSGSPAPQLSSIAQYLSYWATHTPDASAVLDGECRLSYAGLAQQVDGCARAFLAVGIRPGDRVAMLTSPRLEFLVVLLALSSIGGVWVGLNPRHRFAELDYVLGDCAPRLLIGIEEFEGHDYRPELEALARAHELLAPPLFISTQEPDLTFFSALQGAVVEDEELNRAAAKVMRTSPMCVIYTSGSTGRPKGALLNNHGLIVTHRRWLEHLGLEDLRIVSDLPVDHIGGLERAFLSLIHGGTVSMLRRFAPDALLSLMDREAATLWLGELTQLIKCAPLLDDYELDSLQIIGYYGGRPTLELLERYRSRVARIFTGYGMTETSNAVVLTGLDAPSEALAKHNVGHSGDGLLTRLVASDGDSLGPQAEGFLQLRGEMLFMEYLNRPEATADAFTSDGWFQTGDIFRELADGSFEFMGRGDDTYKSGGYNIYPREIEAVLESHRAVGLAAVVDVPDEVFQAVGHAFVEPANRSTPPTAQELLTHCRERLANYKIPKALTILDELPTLRNEKVDKLRLREMARGESN